MNPTADVAIEASSNRWDRRQTRKPLALRDAKQITNLMNHANNPYNAPTKQNENLINHSVTNPCNTQYKLLGRNKTN